MRDRRGGWCFELNGTFARLLEALGFTVTRYSAAVVLCEPGTPDFAHLTLRVDLDRPWLCDVGFGDSFTAPLLLDETGDQERERPRLPARPSATAACSCARTAARSTASRLEAREMHQFQGMCDALQTPPGHFTDAPICSLRDAGRARQPGRDAPDHDAGRGAHASASWPTPPSAAPVLRDVFGVDLGGAELTDSGSGAGDAQSSLGP